MSAMPSTPSREWEAYKQRAIATHGERLDLSAISDKFLPFFGTRDRVKVRTSYGEEMTGTISVTTGWRPSLMLMRRSNSTGSSDLLSDRDALIAVKRGNQYTPL